MAGCLRRTALASCCCIFTTTVFAQDNTLTARAPSSVNQAFPDLLPLVPGDDFPPRGICAPYVYVNISPTAAVELRPINQPSQKVFDRLTLSGPASLCNITVGIQTGPSSSAPFDLTLLLYTNCP